MINKKHLFIFTTLIVVFSGWSNFSIADNQSPLVVTANRFKQPVSSVLAPVTIVTRDEIDSWQSNSLVDVLRRLPGVDISQYGGIGQSSSLFIRGSDSRHVLILVDGIRLNQAGITGSSDLSQIPLSLVQKIEYIRGARSAVYGSDAIGGVLNIITTRERQGTTLNAGIGSYGYQNYNGSTQQNIGEDTVLNAAAGYTYTKGFDVVADGNTGGHPQPDRDGFMSKALWLGINHKFNDQFNGFVRASGFNNRSNYDGDTVWDYPYARSDTREFSSRSYDIGFQFNQDAYSSQLIASYSHAKDYNFDPKYGRYDKSSYPSNSKQYSIQWGNSLSISNGTISSGIDWERESVAAGSNNILTKRDIDNTGLYLTAQQKIHTVIVEGAVRSDKNSEYGWNSTWQTGMGWEFIDGYRLIASYGTAFKAPTLGQLYSKWGNVNLKPEQSKQWEGGIEGFTGILGWRLNVYRNEISKFIDFKNNHYYNIKEATIKGVEWVGNLDTGIFQHQLSLQYVDPRDGNNQPLARRAKQQVKYQLDWEVLNIDWGITYQYLGQRYDTDTHTYKKVSVGGVSLWDLNGSYPVTDHLTIHARIANLFDKNYETAYGYRTPGREYFITGSYNF